MLDELQCVLAGVNMYHKFIPNYAKLKFLLNENVT